MFRIDLYAVIYSSNWQVRENNGDILSDAWFSVFLSVTLRSKRAAFQAQNVVDLLRYFVAA